MNIPRDAIALCALIAALLFPESAHAQYGAIRAGTDFPLRYTLGYTINPAARVSFPVNAGVLTDPYADIAIRLLSHSGIDDAALGLARESFRFGAVYDIGANLNIGRGYIGIYGQIINLFSEKVPAQVIGDYLGIDLSVYDDPAKEQSIAVQSTIYQAGMRFGTRFPISRSDFELQTELSISANVSSNNGLSSETPLPPWIHEQFDDKLKKTFRTYLFVPSIGVFLVYNLHE